jgi:hypothetical protein
MKKPEIPAAPDGDYPDMIPTIGAGPCRYLSRFDIGDRVTLDDDTAIVFVVTAIVWRKTRVQLELSWFNNGEIREAFIDDWRATFWDAA